VRRALMAAALIGLALLVQDQPAETVAARASAGGSLSLANSRAGAAIFTADNLAPGDSTSGTVPLTNTGTLTGSLALWHTDLTDVPGPGGGALSDRLELTVAEQGAGGGPLYSGRLSAMPVLPLGGLAVGTARTFSFTASLPEGTGDNAYAGASASVRYAWALEAGESSAPSPVVDAPPRIRLRVPRVQRVVIRRRFVSYVRCNEPCRVASHADLPGRPRARTRRLRTGRLGAGRWARLSHRLPVRSARAIRRALRARRPSSLTLTLVVRDDGGNRRVVKRRVVFRPISRRGRGAATSARRLHPR